MLAKYLRHVADEIFASLIFLVRAILQRAHLISPKNRMDIQVIILKYNPKLRLFKRTDHVVDLKKKLIFLKE